MKKIFLIALLLLTANCTIYDFLGHPREYDREQAELASRCYQHDRLGRCTDWALNDLKRQESLVAYQCRDTKTDEEFYNCKDRVIRTDYRKYRDSLITN